MNENKSEILSAVSILALVLFGFYQTSFIDLALSSELETFTGPRAYPRLVLGAMLFLAIIQLLTVWIDRKKKAVNDIIQSDQPRSAKVFLAVVTLTLFTAVFEPLGYGVTIVPLLMAIGYLNGGRNLLRITAFSIAASAVCLAIFRYGLNTVLPEGLFSIDMIF